MGGVSDGTLGISVMRYTNPRTKALRWQKAWFFLHGGVQHAMLSNLSAASSSSSIRSVIEQRRQGGPIFLNGNQVSSTTTSQVQTLWHGDVGYVFSNISNTGRMVIDSKHATGDWASIGTSTQPSSTIQLFSAYIEHSQPLTQFSYSILPGVSQKEFTHKSSKMKLKTLQDDNNISSIFDEASKVVFAVFWQPNGGNVTFETNGPKAESITLVAHDNIALIYKMDIGEITVSDPSQRLANTVITLTKEPAKRSKNTGIDLTGVERGSHGGPKHGNEAIHINIDFPNGGLSGKSVTRSIT